MPSKIDEVSLSKGVMIMENLRNEPDLIAKMSIIALLTNIDVTLISNIEDDSIEEIWRRTDFSGKRLKAQFFKTFKVGNKLYSLVNLDDLSVKDYAEIEYLISEGISPFSNIHKIIETIYRPVIHKNTSPKNILLNIIWRIRYKGIIPQSYDKVKLGPIDENLGNLLLDKADFSFGYGVLSHIGEVFSKLKSEYKLLFPEKIEDEYEVEDENETEFANMWGLYGVIISISNDLFERDAWYNKPVRELFKYLTYQKQKTIYDGRRRS